NTHLRGSHGTHATRMDGANGTGDRCELGDRAGRLACPGAAGGLSPEVIAQIDAIEREKEARTPAERKVDSQLLYALRAAQGLAAVNGVPSLQTDIPTDTTGRVVVDITTQAAAALQGDVAARGGAVPSAIAAAPASATSSVRASISLN